MIGVAKGADVPYLSILALNVRTEIAFGMSKDGCTAMFLRDQQSTFLAQNWDWQTGQQENLIALTIIQEPKPTISMVTEAGIIGKIGLNSRGLGVCLNAIQAVGVEFGRLPCHLALRTCLESETAGQAVATLQRCGVASACHILVADSTNAVGLECTSIDILELPSRRSLTHTNHFIKHHPGVEDRMALKDSPARLERINQLIEKQITKRDGENLLNMESTSCLLEDEDGFPTAVCRARTENSSVATLFSIVMDLRLKNAKVRVGSSSQHHADIVVLDPS